MGRHKQRSEFSGFISVELSSGCCKRCGIIRGRCSSNEWLSPTRHSGHMLVIGSSTAMKQKEKNQDHKLQKEENENCSHGFACSAQTVKWHSAENLLRITKIVLPL